jgi:hypothetical protein
MRRSQPRMPCSIAIRCEKRRENAGKTPKNASLSCLLSQLLLCLSRACVGKMIVFIYRLLKKGVFRRTTLPSSSGEKTVLFAPFLCKTHNFTKTGSGQTQGKLKKRVPFSCRGFFNEGQSDNNESKPSYEAMAGAFKARDKTRLVTWADNRGVASKCYEYADVISNNYYPGWYNGPADGINKTWSDRAAWVREQTCSLRCHCYTKNDLYAKTGSGPT